MSALSKTLRRCWSALPISYRAAVKQVSDVTPLDYPHADLYVQVSSNVDVSRAHSCRKEPETIAWIEQDVSGVFFDIGANIGAYSLVAWAHGHGRTQVVAFEPGLATFPQLCRNILLNGCEGAVIPLNIALSDKSELKHFRYSRLEGGAASHVGLSENAAGRSDKQVAFTQPMWVHALDEAILKFELPSPNHIKVDVDGHELAILRGAENTLRATSVRSLQVEIGEGDPDGAAIRSLLESHGFAVARVAPHRSGRTADYVFKRES